MSENVHNTLTDAAEMQDAAARGGRVVSVAIAVAAVLAALGTLLAHHSSVQALTTKNQAILSQARASDAYGKYEAHQVRYQIAQTLIASGILPEGDGRRSLSDLAKSERDASASLLVKAQTLERSSEEDDRYSDVVLKSYEMLQLSTTFFDIAVVLVSISALARTRALLIAGGVLSAVGIVLLIVGYFRA